ncbi:hypothetical protein ACVWZA_003483 [Sphingomonas sp. UYAg733]
MVARLEVEADRIFLDLENPRHDPYELESQVIEYLCRHENILPLARDIVANGLNPIEQFALIPDDAESNPPTYFVAEGNRRICALMLLHDPDRAPAKLRKSFEQASKGWPGTGKLPCVVFDDRAAVDLWLTRIHDGEQDGVGRRKWSSDQSQRHSGSTKNKIAMEVLNYAERTGLISADDRRGKLTTVSRYLTKKPIQEALGLDVSDLENIGKTRSKADFDTRLTKFLGDLQRGHVNSRTNGADAFSAYARELSAVTLSGTGEVAVESLNKGKTSASTVPKRRRTALKARVTLPYEHEIMDALKELESQKLTNLYDSICSIPLNPHAPLISIGMWAFLESLTARAGRSVLNDFQAFFSKERLQSYGLSRGKGDKSISEALRRVSASGDVTKHDPTAAMFNGEQLANDMDTLKNVIVKCAEEAAPKT